MKLQKTKPTISITVSGVKLNVIRVGTTPKLKDSSNIHLENERIRVAHSHFTYEVFFITKGKLEIVTERGSAIYERKIVIIPPRIAHYTIPEGDGCYCLLFSFENATDRNVKGIGDFLNEGIFETDLSDDIEYFIGAIVRRNDQHTSKSEKDSELLAALIFSDIIAKLMPDKSSKALNRGEAKYIGAIETYINDNFCERVKLSDIANLVSLSTRHASRIIEREYGCSLSQLVIRKKLASAQMLLKNTDMKIGEIASRVNLGSENYFYTLFKKNFGMSPLKYRMQYRNTKK